MGIVFSGSLDEIGIFQLKTSLEAHVKDDLLRFASVMYNELAYSCGSSCALFSLTPGLTDFRQTRSNKSSRLNMPRFSTSRERGDDSVIWFVIDRASNPEGWIMEHALRKPETDLASTQK